MVNRINVSYCPCDEVTTHDVTKIFAAAERGGMATHHFNYFFITNRRTKYTYHLCEKESILLKLTLVDSSQDESEVESYNSCAVFDKQQEEAANKFRSP